MFSITHHGRLLRTAEKNSIPVCIQQAFIRSCMWCCNGVFQMLVACTEALEVQFVLRWSKKRTYMTLAPELNCGVCWLKNSLAFQNFNLRPALIYLGTQNAQSAFICYGLYRFHGLQSTAQTCFKQVLVPGTVHCHWHFKAAQNSAASPE